MADLESQLQPLAEGLLEPGEELLGCCVASRQSGFKGWMVALVVTENRLIVQRLAKSKQLAADGEPLSLTPETIASARAGAGGAFGATPSSEIMDRQTVQLKLKTTEGEKLKLMMMRGEGAVFERIGGGEVQAEGVHAVGEWFERHAVVS